MQSRTGPVEDDDIELPPLDADDEGGAVDTSEDEALIDALPTDEGDALDDSVASDLEIGSQLDDPEDLGGDDDDTPIDDASLGDAIEALDETLGEGDEEGIAVEDEDLDRHDALEGDDGGAEGTGEPIEDEIDDGALPELDADEGGDFEVGDLLPQDSDAPRSVDLLPPWANARWAVLQGAGSTVPSCSVSVGTSRVIASGDVVLRVHEAERAARRVPDLPAAYAVATTDAATFLATARGLFAQVGQDAPHAVLPPPKGRAPIKLASTASRAWARRDEALWRVTASSSTASPLRERGCLAIAACGATLIVLAGDGEGHVIERSHAEDRWESARLDPRASEAAASKDPLLAAAAGGRVVALAARDGELFLSRDAGASFDRIGLGAVIALCFEGDADDAPLLSLHGRDGEESAYLVRSAPGAASELVAEIAGAADDVGAFGAVQMAWDAARDVLWVACHAGLIALGATRTH